MKKRIMMVLMILVLAMSLVACGGKQKNSSDSDPKNFKLGDFELSVKDIYLMKDDGDDLIVLKMDFTNHSKEPTSYVFGIGPDVSQKDMALDSGVIFLSEDGYDTNIDGQLEDVDPDKTAEIFDAYILDNLKDEVVVKFWTIGSDKTKEIKIDPSKLTVKDSLE